MKWEYLALELPKSDGLVEMRLVLKVTNHELIECGKEGWELVSVDNGIAYFKRELRNVSKPKITHITDDNSARVIFKQSYDD